MFSSVCIHRYRYSPVGVSSIMCVGVQSWTHRQPVPRPLGSKPRGALDVSDDPDQSFDHDPGVFTVTRQSHSPTPKDPLHESVTILTHRQFCSIPCVCACPPVERKQNQKQQHVRLLKERRPRQQPGRIKNQKWAHPREKKSKLVASSRA